MSENPMSSPPVDAPPLRQCLVDPIPQIADAARFLDAAVSAHLRGKSALAEDLIRLANIPDLYKWLKPIWADSTVHLRYPMAKEEEPLSKDLRAKTRMPTGSDKERI